eukprot:3784777-Rhodomonas_salina.1
MSSQPDPWQSLHCVPTQQFEPVHGHVPSAQAPQSSPKQHSGPVHSQSPSEADSQSQSSPVHISHEGPMQQSPAVPEQ